MMTDLRNLEGEDRNIIHYIIINIFNKPCSKKTDCYKIKRSGRKGLKKYFASF